jgi:hypothetical protein
MKVVAVLFVALTALSAFAQEHAPTPEQCKADHMLWFSEFSDPRTELPESPELLKRSKVLIDCEVVDPAHEKYFMDLSWGYTMVILTRYQDFVFRHKLQAEMQLEDLTKTRSKGVR